MVAAEAAVVEAAVAVAASGDAAAAAVAVAVLALEDAEDVEAALALDRIFIEELRNILIQLIIFLAGRFSYWTRFGSKPSRLNAAS